MLTIVLASIIIIYGNQIRGSIAMIPDGPVRQSAADSESIAVSIGRIVGLAYDATMQHCTSKP